MPPHPIPHHLTTTFPRNARIAKENLLLQAKAASTITKYWKLHFKHNTLPRLTDKYVKLDLLR